MKQHKNKPIKDSSSDKIFVVINYTLLTLLSIIVLFPLLYVVAASFSDPQAVIEGKVFIWPVHPTLRGYEAVFGYSKIMLGFRNSFIYLILGTSISIFLTILAAYPLSRREFKARRWLSAVFMFTMIFSGGLIPTYLMVQSLGMLNTIWAMVIPSALSVWNVMICRTYFSSTIPDSLYEAASIDGCSPIGFLRRIILPLSKPIIAVLVLYYGVGQWNSYFNALIYLQVDNLQPLQIALRNLLIMNSVDPTMVTNVQAAADQRGLTDLLKYATIVVASLPVLAIYPWVQRYFIKGVMIGSIKG